MVILPAGDEIGKKIPFHTLEVSEQIVLVISATSFRSGRDSGYRKSGKLGNDTATRDVFMFIDTIPDKFFELNMLRIFTNFVMKLCICIVIVLSGLVTIKLQKVCDTRNSFICKLLQFNLTNEFVSIFSVKVADI